MNPPNNIVRQICYIGNSDLKLGIKHIENKVLETKKRVEEVFAKTGLKVCDRYETFNDQPDSFFCGLFYDCSRKIPLNAKECMGPFRYEYVIIGKKYK